MFELYFRLFFRATVGLDADEFQLTSDGAGPCADPVQTSLYISPRSSLDKLKLRQAVKYSHHSLVSWRWIPASICSPLMRFITPLVWTVLATEPLLTETTINLQKPHFPMHKTHSRGEHTLNMGTPCFVHDLKAIQRHLIFIKNCQHFLKSAPPALFLVAHSPAVRYCLVSGIFKLCLISVTFEGHSPAPKK